jgi:hypothetical protein
VVYISNPINKESQCKFRDKPDHHGSKDDVRELLDINTIKDLLGVQVRRNLRSYGSMWAEIWNFLIPKIGRNSIGDKLNQYSLNLGSLWRT